MHQTRCIRCTRCTRPDVSTASLLLVTIRPCTNCNSGIATSQDCVGKQRENQKVHATPQPTLAPAKIVLEKYAIRKPCCKCTGIAVGASNLSQPWRFLPCLQILLTLSYHIMLTKSFWSIYARVQLLSIHVVPGGGGHKERGKTTITVSKKIRGAADTT